MSLNNITGNQYGLIIPNKKSAREPAKIVPEKNVFGEESEDEEDAKFKHPTFDVKMETLKASLRKSTKINLEKALEEDASVFQYDEVYDEITRQKEHKISEKSMPSARKSKYVNKLLEVSAVRKLEKELHNERKAQRELEAEKDKYADKESFVTGAYKAKMAELSELVEKRRQEEAIEDVMDITKQDGLSGFYRYMYEQKTDSKPISKSQDVAAEKNEKSEKPSSSKRRSPSLPHSKYCHDDDRGRCRPSSSRTRNPSSPPRYREHRTESSRRSEHVRHRPDENKHASSSSHHRHRRHSSSPEKHGSRRHFGFNDRKIGENRRKDRGEKTSTKEVEKKVEQSPPPPGFILAKPRQITDEEIQEARKRYFARKAAGLNRPTVVHSDDEC